MKKGKSDTPLTCALKPFILELSDSAAALVDLLLKQFSTYSSLLLIVSRTAMSSLIRLFPTLLYHTCRASFALSRLCLVLKILRREHTSPQALCIRLFSLKRIFILFLWKSVQSLALLGKGYLTCVSNSTLVSSFSILAGTNFSFLRFLGRPSVLPFLLFLVLCFLTYLALALFLAACRFLNSHSAFLVSATAARLIFMRISSSPLPASCMIWKQSMTISAFGNICLVLPIMLSEKSIVTSSTAKRLFQGILARCFVILIWLYLWLLLSTSLATRVLPYLTGK